MVVLIASGPETGVVGQCVVDPPEPSGDPISDEHVDGIMASGKEER